MNQIIRGYTSQSPDNSFGSIYKIAIAGLFIVIGLIISTPFAHATLVNPCDEGGDALCVGAAQSALATAGSLNPVEGVDNNAITMAQAIVDRAPTTGVVVTITLSENSHVATGGVITYDASAETGNVTFHLTKNGESADQIVSVVVPASIPDYAAIFEGVTATLFEEFGIDTNLNDCALTPDNCEEELYFEKNGVGRITFPALPDLTDADTIALLQILGDKMEIDEGSISLDARTAELLRTAGAEITLYGLDFPSTPNLIVRDDEGNIIDPNDEDYPDITIIGYEEGTLTFTINHFTGFEVDDNIYVDDSNEGEGDGTEANPFQTIGEGVNAAPTGGTVHVAAGNYDEAVTISKPLTLSGAQAGLDARSCTVEEGSESVVGTPEGAFIVQDDNITIDGFTIAGVIVGGESASGAGINISGGEGYSDMTIKNNIIRDNIMGIYLNGNDGTVEQNCIKDNNAEGPASGNGIYSDQGLSDTVISNNKFTGQTNTSVNMASESSSNITVTDNQIVDDSEILFFNVNIGTISANTITDSANHGIQLGGGNSIIDVTGNTVHGSTDEWSAIRINGEAMNSNVTIRNNSLTGNDYGVNINANVASGVTVNFNDLSDNIVSLYYGQSETPLDATNNWWGCSSTPAEIDEEEGFPESVAVCGVISHDESTIDFAPWLSTFDLSGNNPVIGRIMNNDGEVTAEVGFDTGLQDKFTSSGANGVGEAIVAIEDDNTASYNIDGSGPNFGDTTVNGMALFAGQDSTLTGTLVFNNPAPPAPPAPPSGGGGGPVGLFGVVNGPSLGQVLGVSTSTSGQVLGANTFRFTRYLVRGSRGDDVIELHKILIAEGLLHISAPTGYFGPLTQAAVRLFQTNNGLPSVGVVGPLTRAVLNNILANQ
ncbi:MAG: hypothetical protein A2648_01875 [Candidatus Lloydbacteria bacterium RIFCSPHIGHO2_01_FULL_41_20]|uniref:Peptidoglycan binding-like domain-containing protein n=1 Tax=Candidatus Lloydbacteria bacterium RIFCSPHIGHO2_01_FULL_41_20 TaxID=1798657 RepID=A0A1G2CQM9_9BACT|nr:MAG: hypothetical protein A2648_01875 [Candidatus Lloydbacteria bacterium RIFCSPHIGHO2_01_FULL_41_20]